MYEIEEFYAVDGQNLKTLLKTCIYNYYIQNKKDNLEVDELQNKKNHRLIVTTNKNEILSTKGDKHVQTVQ